MKTLIIVESPTKAKTIERFLGKNYRVKSCMGHVRDLPKSSMGVDIEHDFAPHYITIRGKSDVLKTLKEEAKKADRILLAADPDREGEAIAWHLQQYLHVNNENCRIRFNEITDTAIKKAVEEPTPIDINKVEAQQARRILDRLVGYQISPLLWRKVKRGLSAGRVQSVAVRLICDREEEIAAFVPEEYWLIYAHLSSKNEKVIAKLVKVNGRKADLPNRKAVDEVLNGLQEAEYRVAGITEKEKAKRPSPPFTTSVMQQDASRRLGITAKKTMRLAQDLYEGIDINGSITGLITYIRTDSVRVSAEAQSQARSYIKEKYGDNYLPGKPHVFSAKKNAVVQDAHEAIRPTHIELSPAAVKPFLTPQQFKLYKLIWERFVASQMASATLKTTTIDIEANNCLFRASGTIVVFDGYLRVYNEGTDDDKEADMAVAPVKEGDILPLDHLEEKQCFTQPPPRYTEATLIKSLEELGIGRPSTYAPTLDTITSRYYVVREEKKLFPTELGSLVVDIMKKYFPDIIDVEFTASMEDKLDQVEAGDEPWLDLIREFYGPFSQTLAHAEEEMEKVVIEPEVSDEVCDKCGKPMVYRMGRYGRFLACSGFPDCRNTKAIVHSTNVKCLACGGNIIQCKSRAGRVFYGCDNYPECKYVSWDLPIEEKCPQCGQQLAEKQLRNGDKMKICPNKECLSNASVTKKSAGRPRKKTKKAE